ncbi:MAG: hypothetical protein H5T97_11130 [Firmicutes bacterium]|nr:hypothetical protein [Bacillota bacterium]
MNGAEKPWPRITIRGLPEVRYLILTDGSGCPAAEYRLGFPARVFVIREPRPNL